MSHEVVPVLNAVVIKKIYLFTFVGGIWSRAREKVAGKVNLMDEY